MKAKYIFTVSDPTLSTCSSGSTTLPLLLLIFCPSGPNIRLRFILSTKGSASFTNPKSKRTLWKNREYKRCMVVCSAPPEYRFTGIHFLNTSLYLEIGNWKLEIPRIIYARKYHDESTNVSMVSYSGRHPLPNNSSTLSLNSFDVARGGSPVGLKSTSSGRS